MQTIRELKTFNVETTPLEDLVALSFVAKGLRNEFEARGVEVPEWLSDAIRKVGIAITNQTRDAKLAELREIRLAEEKLLTPGERRDKLAARKQQLEQELAGV